MTSEVKADLKIELSDLNYLCSHASLACKGFLEMIHTDRRPIMIHRPACFTAGKKLYLLRLLTKCSDRERRLCWRLGSDRGYAQRPEPGQALRQDGMPGALQRGGQAQPRYHHLG